MNLKIKLTIILFFLTWLCLSVIDSYSFFVLDAQPVFWRGWERCHNFNGQDSDINPFKPNCEYRGPVEGDLLNALKLISRPTERRYQDFLVDEYGQRNEVGFLDQPVDVVIFGSSNVSGPPWSQEDLVASILTDQYKIRAYSTYGGLQQIWEAEKFKQNQPKFVVFIGTDGEVINSFWQYQVVDRPIVNRQEKWNSLAEWKKEKNPFPLNYEKAAARLKDFSLIKHFVNDLYQSFYNFGRTRSMIADKYAHDYVRYYPEIDILFSQPKNDNPFLGVTFKTEEGIKNAIGVLNASQKRLDERNMKLATVVMISKTHAMLPEYKNIDQSQTAIYAFNEQAENQAFTNVDILPQLIDHLQRGEENLYYPDDSHWHPVANQIIAKELAREICPTLTTDHPCHSALEETN